MNYKKLVILFFVLFLSVNFVFASDNSDNQTLDANLIELDSTGDVENNILASTIKPSGDTFEDITDAISNANDGDVVELSGDYYSDGYSIEVGKELTIQGSSKGATLYGDSSIFQFYSHVTLKNLNLVNYDRGIYAESGLTIINCTFDANNVDDSCTIMSEGDLTIKDSKFFNSNFNTYYGGAIGNDYGNVLIENCIFENNTALGGSIFYGSHGKLDIINSKFYNNFAIESGGISCEEEKITIRGSIFKNNRAGEDASVLTNVGDVNIYDSVFENNSAAGWGGTIYGETVNVYNSNFSDNHAGYMGSALYGDILNVVGSNFIHNSAESGGAVYADTLNLSNCNFYQNHAESGGAASCSHAIIDKCNFENNYASSNDKYYGNGGALAIGDMDVSTVSNSVFKNNSARNGGAIYMNGGEVSISKCDFTNNIAQNYGGAISFDSYFDRMGRYYNKLNVKNSNFTNSIAKNGIAIYAYCADVSIKDVLINDVNDANVSDIYHLGGKSVISNTTYKNMFYSRYIPLIITPTKLSTTFASGNKFTFKVIDALSKQVLDETFFTVKVFTGSKFKKYNVLTNSKGVAKIDLTYKVSKGTHKIEIVPYSTMLLSVKKTVSSIKLKVAKTVVKAPKVKVKFKKSRYFKVTVKNKESKKPIKNLKVKVKVYTGKKFKTYTIKTNSKGLAKLNTKSLKKGTHKVVISSGNALCKISAKSSIVVK